ncbi:MAG TPA: YciI family protein [Bacillales bacterium]|nr:YciI family protein [Bacillales bacterium]
MAQFVYLIRPEREGFNEQMTNQEEQVMGRHFEYLQAKLEEGKLIMAGPCLDRAFGIAVFEAVDENEARAFMDDDPSIKEGVMKGELHPYRVSLLKPME